MVKECWDPFFLETKLVMHLDLKWAEMWDYFVLKLRFFVHLVGGCTTHWSILINYVKIGKHDPTIPSLNASAQSRMGSKGA